MAADANRRGENARQDINIGVKLASLRFDTKCLSPHKNSFIHAGIYITKTTLFFFIFFNSMRQCGLFALFYSFNKIGNYTVK